MYYTLKDHQGSLAATVHGNTVERLSYDPWGRRRNPSDLSYDNVTYTFDRGYTLHEHYDGFDLINMNGRLYDPILGRMLSPDVLIQDEQSSQAYNRYAYCLNNPLRYVDPTGWLSGGGGGSGYGDHPPGKLYYVNGMPTVNLPEVTVTDSPILNNEFVYTPYMGGGGATVPWTNFSSGQSIGSNNGGCGGGSGTHEGTYNSTAKSPNANVEISSNIDLSKVNVTCFYINSGNTIIGESAEWASAISAGSKEASVFEKIATHLKILGIIGVGINIGCTTYQMYYGDMPKHEGLVRIGMTGVEFGLNFVPYAGPILSIGLTAFDIGGGFDNNLYKTENWWKEKQP